MDSLTHAQTEAKAEAAAATGQTPTRTLLIALDQSEDDMTAKVIQFTLDHIVKAGDHVILFTSLAYQPATESMLMSVYPCLPCPVVRRRHRLFRASQWPKTIDCTKSFASYAPKAWLP
jgi:hypothetical protein